MAKIGTLLQDRFLIEAQIGQGGMGAVYIAVDQRFGSRVAIKETFYQDSELGEAFEREARLLNSSHHPILPHVSDYFSEGGGHFLVMEFIEGEDLSEILKREGAFPIGDVIRWTMEILDGLDYLHSQDPPIIHRDIKPNNLKLTSRGNIILLDFGLAKETSAEIMEMRSVFGYSRRYSPLEQIEGTGTDARSDIFSLGATVFHLLTGKPAIDVLARASAIVAGRPDPLQLANELDERVPPGLASIIQSSLALNADRRFVSANAMRVALEQAVSSDPSQEVEAAGGQTVKTAAVESFPALLAFKADMEQNAAEIGHYDTIPVLYPAAAASEAPVAPTQSHAAREIPVRKEVRPNAWLRTAAWTAIIYGCVMAVAYGIYVSKSSNEAAEAPVDQSSSSPATAEETLNDTLSPAADEPTVSPSEERAQSKTKPTNIRRSDETREKPASPEQVETVETTVKSKVQTPRTRNTQARQTSRPVPGASETEPPVSRIDTIFTGIPPEREERETRRQLRRQRIWEEGENDLRRRRREIRRENRRRYPPF